MPHFAHSSKSSVVTIAAYSATDPRTHLCQIATHVFAEKGYAKASTREICAAAGVNIAAINYYFGGKAGLYRAIFLQSVQAMVQETVQAVQGTATLEATLRTLYRNFMALITNANGGEHLIRLHAREMLDPSGVLESDALIQVIMPQHKALVTLLCRELNINKPDADISRLVFALIGLAHIYASDLQILNALAPEVLANQDAAQTLVERLIGYATALVAHEAQRRNVKKIASTIKQNQFTKKTSLKTKGLVHA
jgi:TetR/AcrR family transcriptional regulator, regulator of cefoperazone and chloramphenicol sensitivity